MVDTSFTGEETVITMNSTDLVDSPAVELNTVKKRPRKQDASKFNRSNRKSKNCAIYYFRHPDTDNEGNPTRTTSELEDDEGEFDEDLLNANTSDDEEWTFTQDNHHQDDDDDDDAFDEEDEEQTGEGTFRRRLQFTPDGTIETTTETHSNLTEVATSTVTGTVTETNTVQETSSGCKISYICVTKATRESIQRLVLGAESLVRDDVLMKAQEFQVSGSRMCHAVSTVHGGSNEGGLNSPKIRRVQEWLERQPPAGAALPPSAPLTTDCEASGENSGKILLS